MTCWGVLKNFGFYLVGGGNADIKFLLGYVDANGVLIHHDLPRIQALGILPGLSYPSK